MDATHADAVGTQAQGNGRGGGSGGPSSRNITVIVNGTPVVVSARALTGAELKAAAGIPSDYELYVVHGNATKFVADGDVLHLHEGSAFRAIPAGTFGCEVHRNAWATTTASVTRESSAGTSALPSAVPGR